MHAQKAFTQASQEQHRKWSDTIDSSTCWSTSQTSKRDQVDATADILAFRW